MNKTYLDFERPIAELEGRIEELQQVSGDGEANLADEIGRLKRKSRKLTESLFAGLNAWQVTQLARHPDRPYTEDYLAGIFTEFKELHGDRMFADDHAIVAGVGRLNGVAVAVIGHQKGRGTREKVHRNFGMPRPEGYRKAQRIMHLAERFQLPLITLIDTTGAYPGIDAEQRGQSEAIARCLLLLADLRTPILAAVIGEGGSGGALAIGVGDRLLMMQYATYSVISPEGCASILWKKSERAAEAAAAMGLTTERLKQLELIDEVIPEPLGGAHRDPASAALALQGALIRNLHELRQMPIETLIETRKTRLRNYGRFEGGR